jgi:thiamine biosynthesis protein ThiS
MINGKEEHLALLEKTLGGVMNSLCLSFEGRFIALNGQLFRPNQFISQPVQDHDVIEIVQFMGGG